MMSVASSSHSLAVPELQTISYKVMTSESKPLTAAAELPTFSVSQFSQDSKRGAYQ